MRRHAILTTLILIVSVATPAQQGQTYRERILYSFTGGLDGGFPTTRLSRDMRGNLYGTTEVGGSNGWGTVFGVSPTGKERVLYNFVRTENGTAPWHSGVILDSLGRLYGTTYYDGAVDCGTAFQVNPKTGQETILYSFMCGTDGAGPEAGLIWDAQGNLYGTTSYGGESTIFGSVFKLDPAGTETLLHSFWLSDGNQPTGRLLRDAQGNLYGTTVMGPTPYGTVFKLDATGKLTTLHNFEMTDGQYPMGAVVADKRGNLYGTTQQGGAYGYGTVFKLDSTGQLTSYSFTGGTDGTYPSSDLLATGGGLYGTTSSGGAYGYGTVFKLDGSGQLTTLHNFAGRADGRGPSWAMGLIMDAAGNLYGTTEQGGAYDSGTVFELIPN